jgi:hypothetical protein
MRGIPRFASVGLLMLVGCARGEEDAALAVTVRDAALFLEPLPTTADDAGDARGLRDDATVPLDDASIADATASSLDVGPKTPMPIGSTCSDDTECVSKSCELITGPDGATAKLCTQLNCGLMSMCVAGSACYDEGARRLCVADCTTTGTCPAGLTCLPILAPSKGCLPQ